MRRLCKALALLSAAVTVLLALGERAAAQSNYFGDWPAGTSPREVGRRVAENFAARRFEFETNAQRKYVIYPEVCAWYGSLTVARQTKDRDLEKRLVQKFDPLLTPEGAAHISP